MISFVLCNDNSKDLTLRTIRQVSKAIREEPFEVILLDNNSVDGSRELFLQLSREVSWLHYHIYSTKFKLSQIFNRGAKLARGEVLVFLRSGYFIQSTDVDNFIRRELQENAILSASYSRKSFDPFTFLYHALSGPGSGKIADDFFIIRRLDFNELKGFDEQFSCQGFEEDLSLRMKMIKKKSTYVSNSIKGQRQLVIHPRARLGYLTQEAVESLNSNIYFLVKNRGIYHARLLTILYMIYFEFSAIYYLLTFRYQKYQDRSKSAQILSQFTNLRREI